MDRRPVKSSAIASIGYDESVGVLELEFHGGAVYRYFLVQPSVHRMLAQAPSIGNAFRELVKDRYRVERVE